jgi:hypothetical protein
MCLVAQFSSGWCRACCALVILAVREMGVWAPDGNERIDSSVTDPCGALSDLWAFFDPWSARISSMAQFHGGVASP